MPKYVYVGITTGGKNVKGEIQAGSRNDVASLLRKKKIRPISIKNKPIEITLFTRSVRLQDLSRFTRQFAAMQSAGLPLVQCLDILASQTENRTLAEAIKQISMDIQGGSTLADALSKHPKIFNSLFCNMVSAGESSGSLDVVLVRLAEYLEKSEALRRKIKSAMTYPVIVSIVAVLVTVIMLTFIVPTFAQMFQDLGGELPTPTKIVMAISEFFQRNILWLAGLVAAIVFSLKWYNDTEKGRYKLDTIKLRLPVFGDLIRKSSISRFSQTLATLLSSGVTILDALAITAKTAGNKVLEKGLFHTLERISGGMSIADPLRDTGMFPPMVIHMIAVGERTGGLSEMLGKISEFYQEEVDAAIDALTSIIEPLLIVIMGVVIGGILIAMYLPMFDMVGAIS